MKFFETHSSDASVSEVFIARCRQDLRERACEKSGALRWQVQIERTADGGARVLVERSMPPDVPDMFKAFVGKSIDISQVEEWSPAAADGSRAATIRLSIRNQPASMTGTIKLTSTESSGSLEVVEGEVTVAVPFLGKKVEPDVAKVVAAALRIEQSVNDEWIRANR